MDPRTIQPKLPPAGGDGKIRNGAESMDSGNGNYYLWPCPRSTLGPPYRNVGLPIMLIAARCDQCWRRWVGQTDLDLLQGLERFGLLFAQYVADVHRRRCLQSVALPLWQAFSEYMQ